jgi:hypothetical protein
MELSADLPSALVPLAWLLGTWQGVGVVGYPGRAEAQFGQEITFSHVGQDFLVYASQTWLLEADGSVGAALSLESGYWRPLGITGVELVLSSPTGFVEIYLGDVAPAKIVMSTDVVARTATGENYTAGHRLYGLVESDLLWAYDRAADGHPLQAYMSARLSRVGAEESLV